MQQCACPDPQTIYLRFSLNDVSFVNSACIDLLFQLGNTHWTPINLIFQLWASCHASVKETFGKALASFESLQPHRGNSNESSSLL